MKLSTYATAGVLTTLASAAPADLHKRSYIQGFDISHYQSSVDFSGAKSSGAEFVMIKATEGTDYLDPAFSSHYDGATAAGLKRGGYHFAQPGDSSGAAQATYFHEHGGGWSNDGRTLPGMLDIEYGPSGSECYGLSQAEMVSWISDFVDTYHSLSTRYPIIYSTGDWWNTCTGDTTAFHTTCPLDLASWNSSPGTIPGGWPFETFWQYNDHYSYGGDSDYFNGDSAGLLKMCTG